MSTEQPSAAEQQPWGAQPQPEAPQQRARWSGRKTATAVAIAVAIAGGGGAAIYAATASDSGTQQGGPGGMGFGPGGQGGGMGPVIGGGPLAQALHGEFVVAGGATELLQNGKVTAISANSISVTSTDGYAKTYPIDSSTAKGDDIQTGDTVTVIAKESGAALTIAEPSAMPQDGRGQRQQPQPPTTR